MRQWRLEDLAMKRHIAKAVIQILRERLVELETLKATGAAPEDTVRRLAFVRKLLVQFDATPSSNSLADASTDKNGRHALVGLLRQSVFSRLAGYEDVHDAGNLRHDPAMRWIVGGKAAQGSAASPSQMGRVWNGHYDAPAIIPSSCSNSSVTWNDVRFVPAMFTAPTDGTRCSSPSWRSHGNVSRIYFRADAGPERDAAIPREFHLAGRKLDEAKWIPVRVKKMR
jgi:Transposase DDE domain group 1